MNLVALPAFADNYIWMLHDGRQALVVDPGEAAPVMAALAAEGLTLAGILVTHHHGDHVGGIAELLGAHPAPVWGPASETLPSGWASTVQRVDASNRFDVLGLTWQVLDVPGHTAGHVAYFCADTCLDEPVLFCGDTLFSGGCGRLFEGTAAQMWSSLLALSALPDTTLVCCAHEYTLSNLRFAGAVEPGNAELGRYTSHCQSLREAGHPTLPARLARERMINPFLRCEQPDVQAAGLARGAATSDPVAIFAALRQWKNDYR
ncbi:MAG: hydroxyacylglutathione hydrolase [Burkholderiales bacterium]|nr:hydroxyacylglutathione hydrolase [Burkholderiales bacterium]